MAETTWQGPTYYDRPALKPAPFENGVVGGYIFLAGLSGGAAILSAVADATRGREAEQTVRHGRYLALLAPVLGAPLLIYDLHTPQRFANMLRIARGTSPMSIGTWILMAFSGLAGLGAAAQAVTDRRPRLRWPRWLGRAAQVPAALAGAGLSTYTASLLAATSTPSWAAAPKALAVRFGSSALAAGAAALALAERQGSSRRALDAMAVAALAAELAATGAGRATEVRKGIDGALDSHWGRIERLGGTGLGVLLPLALHGLARVAPHRREALSDTAAVATLLGSLLMRVSVMGTGDVSAERPDVSFRFAQPENLPQNSSRLSRKVSKA